MALSQEMLASLFDKQSARLEASMEKKIQDVTCAFKEEIKSANEATKKEIMDMMDAKIEGKFQNLATDVEKLKASINAAHDIHAPENKRARSVGAPMPRSGATRSSFRPTKVFVQGFYDFKSDKGALREHERDQWAQTLKSHLPSHLADQFQIEKKYKLTRRLVFSTKGEGGESCWEVREKFADAIATNDYKINSKDLRVRVEEDQGRADRRKAYWKAVDALRGLKREDIDFIIEPATFAIHDQKTLDRLGKLEDDEFKWNADVVGVCFPDIDLPALRRATLQGGRQ